MRRVTRLAVTLVILNLCSRIPRLRPDHFVFASESVQSALSPATLQFERYLVFPRCSLLSMAQYARSLVLQTGQQLYPGTKGTSFSCHNIWV